MIITGADLVTFGVEDMDASQRFFRDFGLEEVESGRSGSTFIAKDGSGVLLRDKLDPGLPLGLVDGPTFRETIWGVADQAALEAIGAELSTDRQVALGSDGVLRSTDDTGYALAFRVSQRTPFVAEPSLINIPGLPAQRPVNTIPDFSAQTRPSTLGHIVFFTPDIDRSVKFYTERLGFRVTDLFTGKGAFLRSQGSSDHHNLFLVQREGQPVGFHHVAFHVRDHLEMMLGGRSMTSKGWETVYGPGRHIFGSNHFWYFKSPLGGAIEYDADMDIVDDRWVPRVAEQGPDTAAIFMSNYTTKRG
jgi:catechol 2,3-dioxygenase-like lactoylglutathione lyase family enzyme